MQYIHSVREYLNPLLTTSKFKESGVLTPEEYIAAGDYLVYKFPSWSWASGEEGKRRDYLPNDKQYLVTRNVPCLKRVKQMEDTTDELNFGLLNTLSAATAATAGMEEDADGDWMTTAAGSGGAAADSSTGRERGRDLQEIEGEPCHTSTSTSAAVHLLPADKPLLLGGGEAVGGAGDEANNIQQPENIDDIPDMDEFEDAGVQEIEDLATHKISSSASPGDQTTEAATDSKILKTR